MTGGSSIPKNAGGAADLIVGAPTSDRPEAGGDISETGAVFVLFGGDNLLPTGPATSKTFDINTTQQNISIYGISAADHLGASIATGNVNNDAATDLTIGAPDADGPNDLRTGGGEAYIITGGTALNPPAGSTVRRIDIGPTTVALTVFGSAAGDHLGARPLRHPVHAARRAAGRRGLLPAGRVNATDVKRIMLDHVFTGRAQLHEAA